MPSPEIIAEVTAEALTAVRDKVGPVAARELANLEATASVPGITILEHPPFGQEFYARQVRDEELETLTNRPPQQVHLDRHGGYWSMSIPSLSSQAVKKAVHALRLMAGNSGGMVCTYIETPEIVVRFDFKQRVINERWPRPLHNGPVIVPASDPDAAIGTAWHADSCRTSEDIEVDLKILQGELIRFSYRGLHIWVKPARNDELMRHNCNDAEWRARGLLREMIGPEEFQRYLKRGFITCKGRSTGHIYILRGGHSMVDCMHWDATKKKYILRERLCVQFKAGDLPHTDGVIMRKLFVENDEMTLRHASNISKIAEIPSLWPDYLERAMNDPVWADEESRRIRENLRQDLANGVMSNTDPRSAFQQRAG